MQSGNRRGNGRARSRGYGNSHNRRGGSNRTNYNKHNNSSSYYVEQANDNISLESSSDGLLSDKDILEKRRKKFEADAETIQRQQDSEYGLISRGEDMRLRDSSEARQKLFDTVSEQLKVLNDPDSKIKPDQILMSFRKLREGLLTVKPDNFTKVVLLSSVRFSVSLQHYQSYIPSIHQLIEMDKNYDLLTDVESKEVLCYLILHVSHFSKELENAFSILLRNFNLNNTKPSPSFDQLCNLEDDEIVFLCLNALANDNYFQWLQAYRSLEKDRGSLIHKNFIKLLNYRKNEILKTIIKNIGSSYFTLGKNVLESFTNTQWSELVEVYGIGWTLNREQTAVTIRKRKTR